jgi:hypothetical protein
MFNLGRIIRFLGRVLGFVSLISLPILALAFVAEAISWSAIRWDRPDFWMEVGLNMLPFVVVISLIYWLAGRFVRDVYRLKNVGQGVGFLIRCQFGRIGFGPWLVISQGKVELDLNGLVVKQGGPGGLVIHNDTALVLEQKGQLTRVEGPGFPSLNPFEMIYDFIDLAPKRRLYTVEAMTKEGIAISWMVEVQYKIADDGQNPTEAVPHPFTKEAVFRAATGKWRRAAGRTQDMDWEGWLIVSQTEAALRSILARRFLDELIGLTERDRVAAREAIQSELEAELRQIAPHMGAKILQVKLDTLKVSDEVTQQWLEDWQDHWQQWAETELAEERAKNIQTYEAIKKKAELVLTVTLSQVLQKLDPDQARSITALRLFEALNQVQPSSENHYFLPAEAFEMLSRLIQGGFDHNMTQNGSGSPTNKPPGGPGRKPKEPIPFRPPDIPIIGQIAAGQAQPFQAKDVLGYIQHTSGLEFTIKGREEQRLKAKLLKGSRFEFDEGDEYFALEVRGDSMDQAGIACGDYVILAPVRPANGDIVAAVFHDDDHLATLKRIYFGAKVGGVILQPESSNPDHRPRVFSKKDFAGANPSVEVAAVAVAVLKPQPAH